uniref:Uncharacterized protein n=1 Tax=Parascaris univalens TaxID=6257 RepID=A0A915BYL7_PARUN
MVVVQTFRPANSMIIRVLIVGNRALSLVRLKPPRQWSFALPE